MLKNYLAFFSPNAVRSLSKLWMPIGERVVIIGGGIHGCEMAEFLVKRGRKVTMVDTAESMQDDRWPMFINAKIFDWLAQKGVTMLTGVTYDNISDKGLTITTKEGEKRLLPADSVIPVIPLATNDALAQNLEGKVPAVYTAGDAGKNGLIIDAMADGYRVAREL
jgi:2,4-dienoyl-CoA reductase (NADPH2)